MPREGVKKPAEPRRYDNSTRAEQARATRRRILDATYRLLLENGYAATTIKAVAGEAGVSIDTVYKAFGTKGNLIKGVYDVVLAGDDEPTPLMERPVWREFAAETSAVEKLHKYAAVCRMLSVRLSPLLALLLSAARSGNPELAAFADTIEGERLVGAGAVVRALTEIGGLRADLGFERARDIVWTLNSPQVYQLLVGGRGWTDDEYETWLAGTLTAQLIG
ncbi:TetR/AcrR family transcriptional regulator [Amycolatopsis sp. MEPSY49]|uniref:TetR/AcrR family transcriptional regulator n=1 Tax=Amycolatopsis sp. MEPSY49 TaxID=3151600 RepID=UPI003EFA3DF9